MAKSQKSIVPPKAVNNETQQERSLKDKQNSEIDHESIPPFSVVQSEIFTEQAQKTENSKNGDDQKSEDENISN